MSITVERPPLGSDGNAREYATRIASIAERYLRGLVNDNEAFYALDDISPGLRLRDFFEKLVSLKMSFTIADAENGGYIPCLLTRSGLEPIPIDLNQLLQNPKFLGGFFQNSGWETSLGKLSIFGLFMDGMRKNQLFNSISFRQTKELLVTTARNIQTFFMGRFDNTRNGPNDPFVDITVRTRNDDLQIYYSHCYSLHWNYLGSPTTPLEAQIEPGWYLFGADGGALSQFTYDEKAIIKIPPLYEFTFTKF